MRDESGYTLIELMVGMMVSMLVFGAILMMVQVATRSQDRVSERVYANQRGRPVMKRMIDRLHSACVSPGLAPVQEGSTGEKLILLSKSGTAVTPVPNTYVYSVASGKVTETVAIGAGAEPANWAWGAPSTPQQLVDGVGVAQLGEPAADVPLFRYFAYEGGQVASTPLATPLTKESAAKVVQVNIAFTVSPSAQAAAEPNAAITLSDSATLRIEPASEDSAQVNLPCV